MQKTLPKLIPLFLLAVLGIFLISADEKKPAATTAESPKPLRALLITGGCCHDYEQQKSIISTGVSERARVEWTIVHEGGSGREHQVSVYAKENWTEGYDVIVHNECFGGVKDSEFVTRIARAHHDTPAVVLHCSMHSYRAAESADEWRKFLGVTSKNHGKHHPITIENLNPKHPVMIGFPESWTTPQGELYRIEKLWDTATALGRGTSFPEEVHTCIWVNEYGEKKSRVFGTTIGHHNETMIEETYLDLITRGLLWATGNLNDDGSAAAGYAK
ncbi:MAG: type 1 glutamine amidotransferase [Verrucomicrobiales bacterium]|jgi:type 1 glutamine amidotransferase